MDSHDDLVSIDIDVSLHQRHGLSKHVITSSHEVDIQHIVISDNAEHPLVVVGGRSWIKLYYDPCLRVGLDYSLSL